jgi:putative transposase
LLNEGKDLTEVLRFLEVSESSWNRWRAQYGGMKANGARRLRELEVENGRLKRLLAEAELDKAMLKELAEAELDKAMLKELAEAELDKAMLKELAEGNF